ncbi:RNA polymerase subunit sigma-24 [Rhodococcus sp. SRB_17]|uniref:RNA polymerase sigma factor n=1 Tax=Acidovorax sp. SRB_24 TaxID=1962700 RepID=UPI00145D6A73|nr:sigma-70 family RNA polymerase sigma factor [Acidovorax sp. SRB_24]NMM75805.1 RNA polymerase subunit sigma-24 [Acidovorax sp. SRB_24]NMM90065.1 RNA polymerase subunit sigma-24 [Rhodococcus sp. SRB_17]
MIQTAESRYNQWVREHYRFLLRSAWALMGSRAVAEDVVQDCFTSAWQHRKQLRDPALARAWLFQIMRRHALRHMVPHHLALDDDLPHASDVVADGALDDQLDVVKALARIAPIHREVLVLFYFDDMPTAQMAQALEVAPGTVLSRLSRAREALRAALHPTGAAAAPSPAAPRLRKV